MKRSFGWGTNRILGESLGVLLIGLERSLLLDKWSCIGKLLYYIFEEDGEVEDKGEEKKRKKKHQEKRYKEEEEDEEEKEESHDVFSLILDIIEVALLFTRTGNIDYFYMYLGKLGYSLIVQGNLKYISM